MNWSNYEILANKFLKFGVVGFSGAVIDFGLTYLCKEIFKINKYLANSIGFMVAASSNYILNRIWTFHSHNPEMGLEYGKFLGVSLVGLAINNFFIWLFCKQFKLNFWVSKMLAVGVTLIWNFFANHLYTFASQS